MKVDTLQNKQITVLISCVGRQVSLVRQFKAALPPGGRVITADSNRLAAGAAVADVSHIAPPISSPGYVSWMLELCRQERVTLLLTLLSEELPLLEQCRQAFEGQGVHLIGMPPSQLSICLDKRRLSELCCQTGLTTPRIWGFPEIKDIPVNAYPLVAKVAKGKGSRGQFKLADKSAAFRLIAELEETGRVDDYCVQPLLNGQEYGLDLVNNLSGQPAAVFVRRKLRMRGGETEIAETVTDESLNAAGHALAERLGHSGLVDCDIMRCADKDYLLDVNPRFGGGYIFSHKAGANVPAALLAWLQSRQPEMEWLTPMPGLVSARISDLQVISGDVRL